MALVTVITPTYNRGYSLGRLFDSLQCQSSKNFEWLIVDDGSTDDTNSILDIIQNNHNMPKNHLQNYKTVPSALANYILLYHSMYMQQCFLLISLPLLHLIVECKVAIIYRACRYLCAVRPHLQKESILWYHRTILLVRFLYVITTLPCASV